MKPTRLPPTRCNASCDKSSGMNRHLRRGEDPCQRSRAARAAYLQEYRTRQPAESRTDERVAQRARRRAHVRLAELYPVEFNALVQEEQAKVYAEILAQP